MAKKRTVRSIPQERTPVRELDPIARAANVEEVNCGYSEPEAVLERLLDAVRTFSRDAPQADDITALILRYRGTPSLRDG